MDKIEAKVADFFSAYKVRDYAKGQVLLLNGDEARNLFYLEKGKVKVYDVSYRGDEVILNVFKPKAFFPVSHILTTDSNRYIYEAETDLQLRQAPAADVLKFLETNPDVVLDLLRRVYVGVDGIMGRIAYLMSGSAKSRLIYELIIEARRFGKMNPDGSCALTINEKDLGARAGLSRETVSREVHKLKQEKLVRIENKDIFVTDMKALEQKLSQEL